MERDSHLVSPFPEVTLEGSVYILPDCCLHIYKKNMYDQMYPIHAAFWSMIFLFTRMSTRFFHDCTPSSILFFTMCLVSHCWLSHNLCSCSSIIGMSSCFPFSAYINNVTTSICCMKTCSGGCFDHVVCTSKIQKHALRLPFTKPPPQVSITNYGH